MDEIRALKQIRRELEVKLEVARKGIDIAIAMVGQIQRGL